MLLMMVVRKIQAMLRENWGLYGGGRIVSGEKIKVKNLLSIQREKKKPEMVWGGKEEVWE